MKHLKLEALKLCYDAVPTDGLGITNSDLDQLGANSYHEVDTVLKDWVVNTRVKDPTHPVFRRHLNSMFKRNNPYNISVKIYSKVNCMARLFVPFISHKNQHFLKNKLNKYDCILE